MDKKQKKDFVSALAHIESMLSEETIEARMKNTGECRHYVVSYLSGAACASLSILRRDINAGRDFYCTPLSILTGEQHAA